MGIQELYELDFFEWTQRNAELLSQGRFESADIPHIAAELADLGKRDRRETESFLQRLMVHLLKWQTQPARRSGSWRSSIDDSRVQLEGIFKQSPTLQRHASLSMAGLYPRAADRLNRDKLASGGLPGGVSLQLRTIDARRFPPRG